MLNGSTRRSEASRIALYAAQGGGAFILGIVITLVVVQMRSQQQQIAQMSDMVAQLSQAQQFAQEPQDVTRTVAPDLLTVTAPAPAVMAAAATPNPATQVMQALAAGESSVAPKAPEPAAVALTAPDTTANKIRSLVNAALTPSTQPELDKNTLSNARRLETLAIIHAGMQELVTAVVKGNYESHTNYKDADFSGRIHFAFVGHEEDQTELERFLAAAAENGIVKHSNSVVSSDGSVNGHILLFDLVERALENGTPEEQRAGTKIRREAQQMLAKAGAAGGLTNAQGEKFYVVEPGDSLAYTALQFYGNTNDFERIYKANRTQISQPDKIRVGQRLRIPKA
ncbi:LysM peptidoglycan-binding domain-containing protein [Sulfitobacter sp.]|uniref:LysM peptidoglycan-binding domain-containing protein n=1 Tax=Sulfitobacter sp. TaxID=1903071 RepID=UPI003001223E